MTLKRVRLELARNPEFPDGSARHGYDFTAPLDAGGHLGPDEWRRERARCTVRRFWAGEPDETGLLVHRRGGSWAFDYGKVADSGAEPGFKFDRHTFVVGEYVSITEHDHVRRTFRVVSVEDVD